MSSKKVTTMLIVMVIVMTAACAMQTQTAPMPGGDIPVFGDIDRAPYIPYLFDATPVIKSVTQTPAVPLAGQPVKVSVVAGTDPKSSLLKIKRAELRYSVDGGGWQTIEMMSSDTDQYYFVAFMPPAPQGAKVRYYVAVYDQVGAVTTETPGPLDPEHPEYVSIPDADDPDEMVPPDVDITSIEASYDADTIYVNLHVQGTPNKGNMSTTGAYMYVMPIRGTNTVNKAGFLTTPVMAYAPLMAGMLGIPQTALFSLGDIMTTHKAIENSGIKMKKEGSVMRFRVNRAAIAKSGDEGFTISGITLVARSIADLMPWEATTAMTVLMRSHEYTVAAAPSDVTFEAGAASRDITPPVGTPLGGYGDRFGGPSTGVHDPLMANVAVIRAGSETVALITTDFFYMRRQMVYDIGKAVEEATGIPRDHIVIAASHSHSSSGGIFPELAPLGGQVQDGLYDRTVRLVSEAVIEAVSKLAPARIGTATVSAEGFNGNRAEKGGITDPNLSVVKIEDASGNVIAVMFNFAAHPTVLSGANREFSADWVGYARTAITEKYRGAKVLFYNGSVGNMAPACPVDICPQAVDGFTRAEKIGRGIADIVTAAAGSIRTVDAAPFVYVTREALFDAKDDMWITMAGLRIGDAAMVTSPGELFVELGMPVRESAVARGAKSTFILGVTNDGIGYIVPEPLFKKRIYEATFCIYGPGEAPFVQQNMQAIMDSVTQGMK